MRFIAAIGLLLISGPALFAAQKDYVYVHDRGTPFQVFGFRVKGTGELVPVPGSPFVATDDDGLCGGLCQTMSWSDRANALFASGPSGVSVFKIKKNGKLTLVNGSPFGEGAGEFFGTAAIDSGAKTYVVSAEHDGDEVRVFKVKSNLKLKELAAAGMTEAGPVGLAARGSTIVVCNEDDQSVSSFRIAKDGTLTSPGGATGVNSSFVYNIQLSSDGLFAWQLDVFGDIYGFAVDASTGALTKLATPTDSGLALAGGGLAVADGLVLAFQFAGDGTADVAAFRPEGNGSLTRMGFPQSSGLPMISAHALSEDGTVLVAASELSNAIHSFQVDPTTGVITLVDAEPITATRINAVVFARR